MPTERILQLRLIDQLGNYLSHAHLSLTPKSGQETEVETDARGLVFLRVPEGLYHLEARCHTLVRNLPLKLQTDESLTLSLYPEHAAQLTIRTCGPDGRHPLPSFVILRADVPAFPAFADPSVDDPGCTGAVFTDEKGTTSLLLPPGTYAIKATHGFTYQPVEKEITLGRDEDACIEFSLTEEFALPPGWYSGDDHVHCLQCWPGHHPACPDFTVPVAAQAARANGLDWFTPTDNLDPASNLYLPLGKRVAETIPGEFLCLIGDEVDGHNAHGSFHCNLVGTRAPIGSRGAIGRVNEVLDEVLQQGGTVNICHIPLGTGAVPEIEDTPDLPNLEVWSCEDDIDESMPVWFGFLNRGRKLHAVAHSDSTTLYWPGDFVGVRRTYIDIGTRAFTKEAVISALKDGHSFCTDGPLLFLTVNGKGPGDHLERAETYEIHVEVFSLTPLVHVSLIAQGEKIREWPASGSRFEVTDEVEAARFSWILATAEATDTVYAPTRRFKGFAFTNPVWIGELDAGD